MIFTDATDSCEMVGRSNKESTIGFSKTNKGGIYMIYATIIMIILIFVFWIPIIYLFFLLVKALKKYIKSSCVRKEKNETKVSLGEVLKTYRTKCKMTQKFVAENLGVSRQAVSKWENGTSDPSTSNLIALAKLYGISAEEILNEIKVRRE